MRLIEIVNGNFAGIAMDVFATSWKRNALVEFIFYGNYFYGLCAVALSIEASLQQRVPLNDAWFYLMMFIATVLFYSHPYIRRTAPGSSNHRSNWYNRHYVLLHWTQSIITIILFVWALLIVYRYNEEILGMPLFQWGLIFLFPLVGILYYGLDVLAGKYNLRRLGWLKPFLIGFTWAGIVNVYPVLYYDITHGLVYRPDLVAVLLFVKNFMFVAVLCIMFDIKDYAADYIVQLGTFVVKLGLRKTIFYILLPLSVLGLGTFVYYAVTHHFHPVKISLNVIPFVLLILVALSLRKRRSLMYYLVVVDGLMLVKAVCGSVAITYF